MIDGKGVRRARGAFCALHFLVQPSRLGGTILGHTTFGWTSVSAHEEHCTCLESGRVVCDPVMMRLLRRAVAARTFIHALMSCANSDNVFHLMAIQVPFL